MKGRRRTGGGGEEGQRGEDQDVDGNREANSV